MKKLLAIFTVLLLISQAAQADEKQLCKKPPYPAGNAFSRFVSNATGTNFLLSKAVELEVQKALKKELGSNFNVELYPFGGKTLIDGKFRKFSAYSKNISTQGVNISDFYLETLCDYNQIAYKGSKVSFAENMVLKYQGKITQDNLRKTLFSNEYLNAVSNLDVSVGSFSLVKVSNADVALKNNKAVFSYDITMPAGFAKTPYHVSFSSDLKVENGGIALSNINFGNPVTNTAMRAFVPIINKLNPFDYQFDILGNKNGQLKVKNVKILDNTIVFDGVVVIPKNYVK